MKKAKLAAGMAAVTLAAGVGVHRNLSPDELLRQSQTPVSQVEQAPEYLEPTEILAEAEEPERMSRRDQLRVGFIRRPTLAKSAALLPLWAVGAVPSALVTATGPVWTLLGGLLIQFGLLAGLFALAYKALFPHKKLRELFRRKNWKWLFLGAFTVTAANVLLAQLWSDWPLVRSLLLAAVGFGVLALLWKRLCGGFAPPAPGKVRTRLVMER